MAQSITKNQVKKLPITDYKSIRNEIKTGYLMFMSGDGLISDGIQKATKSA